MRHWIEVAAVLAFASLPSAVNGALIANVGADWSDVTNPNTVGFGTWSYRQGSSPLPHVANWTPLGAATPQPAWAPGTSGGNFLPAIFKATSDQFDWKTGDIVMHTTDAFNGVFSGPGNIVWTSPFTGLIDISGSVWMGRDIGRGNDWKLYLNSTLLTSGHIESGDPYSRASPFSLLSGSGGPSALNDVTVGTGDTIRLEITRTTPPGDFVGINLSIEGAAVSAVPEPGSLTLCGIAGLICVLARRQRTTPPDESPVGC
ncbi:MAG: hypothetical protein ACRC33_10820 [Gemmataceae bacterium]